VSCPGAQLAKTLMTVDVEAGKIDTPILNQTQFHSLRVRRLASTLSSASYLDRKSRPLYAGLQVLAHELTRRDHDPAAPRRVSSIATVEVHRLRHTTIVNTREKVRMRTPAHTLPVTTAGAYPFSFEY